jgi:hypothetical protein
MDLTGIFRNSLELLINTFVVAIPNLVKALLILAIGYFISKSIYGFISLVLRKVGVDKYGEKLEEIDIVSKAGVKIRVSDIVAKIIYVFLLLVFIVAATDILGLPALSNLVASAIAFIPNLIVAIIIIVFGMLGADALRKFTLTTCASLGIGSGKLISNLVFYFLFITVFIMALSQANVDTKFLATNLSIIIAGGVLAFSIGYGLASKETVANYLAGRYNKEKLKIGDVIEIDGVKGTIAKLESDSIVIENDSGSTLFPLHFILNNKIKIYK